MEIKDSQRIVVVKPVASKPSCSNFDSISELLGDSINASSSLPTSKNYRTATIKPKTVRLKPIINWAPVGVIPSQVLSPFASNTISSLSANPGNFDRTHQERVVQVEARVHQPKNLDVLPLQVETSHETDLSNMGSHYLEESERVLRRTSSKGRLSSDGYYWRKYGQKQVKGSECPRSYYKCTQPKCVVRKMVERSFDGNIVEIIYKGNHNHREAKPVENPLPEGQEEGFRLDGTSEEIGILPLSNALLNDKNEDRIENLNGVELLVNPAYPQKTLILREDVTAAGLYNAVGIPNNFLCPTWDFKEGSRRVDADDDEPKRKRSKTDWQSNEVGIVGQGRSVPPAIVKSSTDFDVLGDGFRWRKYGQKVVKGNPYPRSYYKCANLKCNVRKHVEKALDDPRALMTKYEGIHNHEMPPPPPPPPSFIKNQQNSIADSSCNTDSLPPTTTTTTTTITR